MSKTILVVDDDPVQRRLLEETIKSLGYQSQTAENGEEALSLITQNDKNNFALMLLDLVMPEMDGMEVLNRLNPLQLKLPVIVQTAHGSIDRAINAMQAGATDFVVKPVSRERLDVTIKNALRLNSLEGEIKRIKRKNTGNLTFDDLITTSPAMKRVIALGRRAGSSNIPVLIEGESGVGKEVIARAIQGESARTGGPFVTVNCGALPENLVESTLFGHEKGSFTGAVDSRKGKFLEANGGTLFLDEIGELPLDAQVKLLRALQEGEIDPVGAKHPVKVDLRLITATNRDMIAQVKEGKFREDLYYRINVFPIWIPPLRERKEDIPELVQHFVTRFAAEEGKTIHSISPEAIELLCYYPWPGNVRQLENAVFRAVVLCDNGALSINEFPQIAAHVEGFDAEVPPAPKMVEKTATHEGPAMIGGDITVAKAVKISDVPAVGDAHAGHMGAETHSQMPQQGGKFGADQGIGIPAMTESGDVRSLEEIEEDMIRLAMGRYRGHMTEIAKRLGIGRSTLYRKMRDIGLQPRADEHV